MRDLAERLIMDLDGRIERIQGQSFPLIMDGRVASVIQQGNPSLGMVPRRPQTTATPAAKQAPFTRLSRKASVLAFDQTAQAFGATPNIQLKPVGGYLRRYRIDVIGTGGAGASGAAGAADAPGNVISAFLLRDSQNQPIVQVDGYGLYLIDLFSAQVGSMGTSDRKSAPSFSGIATTTGNFTMSFYVPLELDSSGYCSLMLLSAAAPPQMQLTLQSAANFFATAPGTTNPSMEVLSYADFWAVPIGQPDLGPPAVGSSAQWTQGNGDTNWTKNKYQKIKLSRVGTFIHTLILVMRDTGASSARVDQWPSTDLTLFVDGVPVENESFNSRIDKIYDQFNVTRPTGVLAYSFRDSIQQMPSQADTHDLYLYTTPATLLEIAGTSGNGGTGPFQLDVYTGELRAVGGVPFNHLAA